MAINRYTNMAKGLAILNMKCSEKASIGICKQNFEYLEGSAGFNRQNCSRDTIYVSADSLIRNING